MPSSVFQARKFSEVSGGSTRAELPLTYFWLSVATFTFVPSTYVTVKPSFAEGKNGEIVTEP